MNPRVVALAVLAGAVGGLIGAALSGVRAAGSRRAIQGRAAGNGHGELRRDAGLRVAIKRLPMPLPPNNIDTDGKPIGWCPQCGRT